MDSRTPLDWLLRLEKVLQAQQSQTEKLDAYYAGDHDLAFATSKYREAFGALFHALSDNFLRLVVDLPVERLRVDAFRVGDDRDADDRALALWKANDLEATSVVAHTTAGVHGTAYVLVDPAPARGNGPRVTIEHPSQVVVETDPADRRERLAALKLWRDADAVTHAIVYLPDAAYYYTRQPPKGPVVSAARPQAWATGPRVAHSLGVVPIVPLVNSPTLLGGGQSDIAPVAGLQDAINKLLADALVTAEYQAYKQRVVTGLEVPKDPVTGLPLAGIELKAIQSRLWAFESPDVKVQELGGSDLSNYMGAMEMIVHHLAAQCRIPPHALMGRVENVSADALKAAEIGLVALAHGKQRNFGGGWAEVVRLSLGIPIEQSIEVVWADPETKSISQLADALGKLVTQIGLPLEEAWARLGASPQEIERWKILSRMYVPLNADGTPKTPNSVTTELGGSEDDSSTEVPDERPS